MQSASDGLEAVQSAAAAVQDGVPFDCVLMDMHMPSMSGPDATARIKQELGDRAPVVVGLTGDVTQNASRKFLASGAVAVLQKPYTMQRIVDVINKHCPR